MTLGSDIAPSKLVKAVFDSSKANQESKKQDQIISAALELTMTKPSINVANHQQIVDVMCSLGKLSIYFNKESTALEAFSAWKSPSELAVIIGQEWDSCEGESLAIYDVKQIKRQGSMLVMDSTLLNPDQVVSHYTVDIGKYEKPTNPASWTIGRDLFNYPLNLNFNPTTQSASDREILFIGDDFVRAVCADCYTRGQVELRVMMAGTPSTISNWSLVLGGNMFGSADFKIGALKSGKKDLINTRLYTFDPSPITIQGLFTFDPKFTIDASLAYETTQDLAANTGFEFELPFQYRIFSNTGLTGKPQFTAIGKPVMQPHAPFLSMGAANAEAHLVPNINIVANLFSNLLDVNVKFDNVLTMDARMDTRCPNEPINISLFSENRIDFFYGGLGQSGAYPLWGTGRNSITCPICDKCPV